MASPVVFIVDLDAAGAPPASDSVRALLALIDALSSEGGELDWRLTGVSLNSPLRAEVTAFTSMGEDVSDARTAHAVDTAFAVLEATNDNEPETAVRALSGDQRKRLRAILTPIKDRAGLVKILAPGRPERVLRADRAATILNAIASAPKRRTQELGSIEGQILAATTHYGSPALRIREFLSDREVLCVFARDVQREIGDSHTLAEIWSGRRAVVSGRISYDAAGSAQIVHAEALRLLEARHTLGDALDSMKAAQERPTADDWGH